MRGQQPESLRLCRRIVTEKIRKYLLRSGDIVFARTGATTGKSFLIHSCPESVFASYLIRIRPLSAFLQKFLACFFQSAGYLNQISENISGSAQPNCNATKLASLELPVPPLNEQRRIVAKLEKLLGKVDTCQKRLERIPLILKRFRQSVLAAACSGRLTEDWREENGNQDNGWNEIRLGDIIQTSSNGLSKRNSNQGKNTVVLRLSDFDHGVRTSGIVREIQLTPEEIKKYTLQQQDLLVVRVNGSRDIAGLFIVYEGKGETYCDHFIRITLDRALAWPQYIKYAANCREGRNYIEHNLVTSAGQNTISQGTLSALPIHLPPLVEQQEIVRRVEALFKFADQIEARYQKAQAHVDKLTQSILAKAFRGELVPQDPEDEPAAVLLERIRTQQHKK